MYSTRRAHHDHHHFIYSRHLPGRISVSTVLSGIPDQSLMAENTYVNVQSLFIYFYYKIQGMLR